MKRISFFFLLASFFIFSFSKIHTELKEMPLCEAVKFISKAMEEEKLNLLRDDDEYETLVAIKGFDDNEVEDKTHEIEFSAEYGKRFKSFTEAKVQAKKLAKDIEKCLGINPSFNDYGKSFTYEFKFGKETTIQVTAYDSESFDDFVCINIERDL